MTNDTIARNRLGLGAKADESPPPDPRRWLLAQLEDYEPAPVQWRAVQRTSTRMKEWLEQRMVLQKAAEEQRIEIRKTYLQKGRAAYLSGIQARVHSAMQSRTPFVERLTHFWSNHFAVSVDKLPVMGFAASFEADAIRPHVLGRFEDLLIAAVRHPAMLIFLDQTTSMGPNSVVGRRASERGAPGRPAKGLNENLAREILELHTLGVRSGYNQADILELARALTGWTLPRLEPTGWAEQTFWFRADLHEPGTRQVLGRSYVDEGELQACKILGDVARAPATAIHIAIKLARHFVADDPPKALVRRLAENFQKTDGDLPSLYRELLASSDTWRPELVKFKSPWDWAISGMRALDLNDISAARINQLMSQLGQTVWRPETPAGYGDVTATWAAPDALLRRVKVAQRLATLVGDKRDARTIAPRVLPNLSQATANAIASAESSINAIALLLASPEFLRR